MRILVGLALAFSVAACASSPPASEGQAVSITTGQALAQLACPVRIAEASAWVNHMPGPNRAAQMLNVDVRLAEPTDTAVILKSDAGRNGTLVLEIRAAPTAPEPGRLAYRAPVPDPLPKRIRFFCRGGEILAIDRIDEVY